MWYVESFRNIEQNISFCFAFLEDFESEFWPEASGILLLSVEDLLKMWVLGVVLGAVVMLEVSFFRTVVSG